MFSRAEVKNIKKKSLKIETENILDKNNDEKRLFHLSEETFSSIKNREKPKKPVFFKY